MADHPPGRSLVGRVLAYVAASIFGLLLVLGILVGALSRPLPLVPKTDEQLAIERDARVDKLINDNGPSALPPISPLTQPVSHPMTISPLEPPAAVPEHPVAPPSQPAYPHAAAPPAKQPATVLPTNNEIFFDAFPESTAKGQLTVFNGASHNAIAKLIDIQTNSKILSFAICAGNQSTIDAIPDGSYRLLFAFGDRFYVETDRFEFPRGFSKFDRPLTFTTTNTTTDTEDATYYRTRYTALSVTLTPVVGGNVTTSTISRNEFDKY